MCLSERMSDYFKVFLRITRHIKMSLKRSKISRIAQLFCLLLTLLLLFLRNFYEHRFDCCQQEIIYQSHLLDDVVIGNSVGNNKKIKNILLYNELPGKMGSFLGTGKRFFKRNHCQFSDCKLFVNAYLTRKQPIDWYDAIVFNINEIDPVVKSILKWPINEQGETAKRRRSQRFVSFRSEAPTESSIPDFMQKKDLLENFFNWSISYRQDADIQLRYGSIRPLRHGVEDRRTRNGIRINKQSKNGSSAIVAWMASHCATNSKREDYVRELRKYIDVDVYGKCGDFQCKRTKYYVSSPECYDMIESKYKFYLSFENSICTDYVTEKFFRIAQLDSIVPVVYGGADYSRIAPPHSYIDARQFKPKQLADYLKKLDADDALFEEYLKWKNEYVVEAGPEKAIQSAFCELCRKLNQESLIKTYTQLTFHWLQPENQCTVHVSEQ